MDNMKNPLVCRYCGKVVNEVDIVCPYCKMVIIFPEYISMTTPPIPPTFEYFLNGAENKLSLYNIDHKRIYLVDINLGDMIYIGNENFECIGFSKEGKLFQTENTNTLFFIKYEDNLFESGLLQIEGKNYAIQECLYVLDNNDAGGIGTKFFIENPSYWNYFKSKKFISTLENNKNFFNSDGNQDILDVLKLHPEFINVDIYRKSKCSLCGADTYYFGIYELCGYSICSNCGNCELVDQVRYL